MRLRREVKRFKDVLVAQVRLIYSSSSEAHRGHVNILWVQRPRRASRWISNMEEVLTWLQGATTIP